MIRFFTSHISSRTVGRAPLRLRRLLPTFALIAVMGGLVFQALQGDRGLRGWQELRAENHNRAEILAALEKQNEETMAKAHRLRSGSLDLDFLDERARIVLGLASEDERIVYSD